MTSAALVTVRAVLRHALRRRLARGCMPARPRLADALEDQDRVVHREPEQDHERRDRHPVGDGPGRREVQQPSPPRCAGTPRSARRTSRRPTAGSARARPARAAASGTSRAAGPARATRTNADDERRRVAQALGDVDAARRVARDDASSRLARPATAVGATSVAQPAHDGLLRVVVTVGHRDAHERGAPVLGDPHGDVAAAVGHLARPLAERLETLLAAPGLQVRPPRTTSSAFSGAPGNAASMAFCACTTGSWSGRLLTFVRLLHVDRRDGDGAEDADGRPRARRPAGAVTTCAMRPHAPSRGGRAARRRARRRAPGRRPRSMPSPSFARTAGRTVTEPTTAIATTSIVASAIEANTASPVTSMPASATMTVRPETTTARPTVADVAFSAASASRPVATLLALAADVEQRVVHADSQADEDDERARGVAHRGDLRDQAHAADRAGDRRDAEQQRHGCGDERAEGDEQDHERDRQRDHLRLAAGPSRRSASIVASIVPGPATCTRASGLAAPDDDDRALQAVDVLAGVVGVTAQRDLDQCGLPACGRQGLDVLRAADLGDLGELLRAPRDVGGRLGGGLRVAGADEDALDGRVAQIGAVEERLRAFAESPTPLSASVRDFVPTLVPAKTSPAMSTSQRTMTVFGRRAEAPAIAAVARPRTPTPGGVEGGLEDMAKTLDRAARPCRSRAPPSWRRATPVLDRGISPASTRGVRSGHPREESSWASRSCTSRSWVRTGRR